QERLCQLFEALRRAVPGELVGAMRDARAEIAALTNRRVGAVRRDDQVVARNIADRRIELGMYADARRLLLHEAQKMQTADGVEADAVDHHALATVDDHEVHPRFQL